MSELQKAWAVIDCCPPHYQLVVGLADSIEAALERIRVCEGHHVTLCPDGKYRENVWDKECWLIEEFAIVTQAGKETHAAKE